MSESGENRSSWRAPGRISRDLLLQQLKRICAFSPGELLEVGAAYSHLRNFELFMNAASRWVGLDQEAASAPDLVASVYAMPFAAQSFDTVLCTQVLEHLAMPREALIEIHRVLRPGGRLVLSAPQTWALHMEPNDYFRYTPHGLEVLMTGAGFTIELLRPCGRFFASLGMLLSHGALHLGLHARHSRVRHFWRRHGIVWINKLFLALERRWGNVAAGNVINWAVLARRL